MSLPSPKIEGLKLRDIADYVIDIAGDLKGEEILFDVDRIIDKAEELYDKGLNCPQRDVGAAAWKLGLAPDEVSGLAMVLEALHTLYPEALVNHIEGFADHWDWVSDYQRAMRQYAPEFVESLDQDIASIRDVAMRLMAASVFCLDPKKPSDAFLADAVIRKYHELFSTDSADFIDDLRPYGGGGEFNSLEMPGHAYGYVMALCGLDGVHEIFLPKPDESDADLLRSDIELFVSENLHLNKDDLPHEALKFVLGLSVASIIENPPADDKLRVLRLVAAALRDMGEDKVVVSINLRLDRKTMSEGLELKQIPGAFSFARVRAREMSEVRHYMKLEEISFELHNKMIDSLNL